MNFFRRARMLLCWMERGVDDREHDASFRATGAGRYRRGDEAQLSGLRDERDHQAGVARSAGRAVAGAPGPLEGRQRRRSVGANRS